MGLLLGVQYITKSAWSQKMYAKSSVCIWMHWINALLSCESLFEWVAGLSDLNKVKNVYHFTIKIYILQLEIVLATPVMNH